MTDQYCEGTEVIKIWSYYGRKSKVIKYYPKPIYDLIIEPFAGTAVYSLFEDNWKKDVILVDKYDVIIKIWKYLQQSRPEDILKLPDMNKGDKLDDFTQLCNEEKWLIGFCIHRGAETPRKTATDYNSWNRYREEIAKNLFKIRHWNIIEGDYRNLFNIKATWFIDPPYQFGGKYYKHSDVNYKSLAMWCVERRGQVIVCENTKSNWMQFIPLKTMQGQKHITTEALWYKSDQNINGYMEQLKLYIDQYLELR